MQRASTWPLLLVWIGIGALLRFTLLSAKPPWTDEFATLVFSLGNSFRGVPTDEAIALTTLLQPLQTNFGGTAGDVISHLLHEDNHPPLYFLLAHFWMKLFPMGHYISVWVARSLPALLGVLSIPAMYLLARVAFGSIAIAHVVAALMAVSPYGIYIAQEARHYTLAILFVISSLLCLTAAIKYLWRGSTIPMGLIALWIVANILGFCSHYFFVLALGAEAIALAVLLAILWRRVKSNTHARQATSLSSRAFKSSRGDRQTRLFLLFKNNLYRLGLTGLGTGLFILAWLHFVLPDNYGSTMTAWIRQDNRSFLGLINPIFQLGASVITMLYLLPVESPFLAVVVVSGILMFAYFCWVVPILVWGAKMQVRHPNYHLGLRVALAFVAGAIAIFFAVTYLKGIDITRGARYSFVYFPGAILLLGGSLAACWQYGDLGASLERSDRLKPPRHRAIGGNGKRTVAIVWLVGFLSAITVVCNWGYQKYYRPDLALPFLEQSAAAESVLIATTHETLVQVGEMMGLAWELKNTEIAQKTNFLLAHQPEKNSTVATETLTRVLKTMPRSLDLWLVNFQAPIDLHDCIAQSNSFPNINGYGLKLYRCPDVSDIRALDE
ncbi:glycosyltransferase family 39 protein [Oscillatoria sp. FACHB-1406]|nr:glycosyltransferase family 39 protein [Oscillatoria sp. FACHB-1406]